LLLAQGIHPSVVMEILGHSQINITMKLYSQRDPGDATGGRRAGERDPLAAARAGRFCHQRADHPVN